MTNEMSQQQQHEREVVRSYEDAEKDQRREVEAIQAEMADRDEAYMRVWNAAEAAGFGVVQSSYPADNDDVVETLTIVGENGYGVMVEVKGDVVVVHSDMMWEVHHKNLAQVQKLNDVVGPGAIVIHCFDTSHLVNHRVGESWGDLTGAELLERTSQDDEYYDCAYNHNWDYE